MKYKYIISFCSGALLGGALGYFYFKNKYEKESRMAIDSVKDYYRSKYGEDIIFKEDKEETKSEVSKQNDDPRPDPAQEIHSGYRMDDKDEYSEEEFEELNKPINVGTKVISEDEFDNNDIGFAQEKLYYYMKDKILVNEDMEEISDYAAYVGEDIDDKFTHDMGVFIEDDPVYIRNYDLGTDYEITPRNASFYNVYEENENGSVYRYN